VQNPRWKPTATEKDMSAKNASFELADIVNYVDS
jgi:hypothetical protein